jgi:hypothetical protein
LVQALRDKSQKSTSGLGWSEQERKYYSKSRGEENWKRQKKKLSKMSAEEQFEGRKRDSDMKRV